MTYLSSWGGLPIGVSLREFDEPCREAILAIADGNNRLRSRAAYALQDMGLARVAVADEWGDTLLTRRGEAMVKYLRDHGDAWR